MAIGYNVSARPVELPKPKKKEPKKMTTTLVATGIESMAVAQKDLARWCSEKIQHLAQEAREAKESLEAAKRGHLKTTGFQSRLRRLKNSIVYYQKIKEAIQQGYYIVPPWNNVQWFAVRSDGSLPRDQGSHPRALVDSVTPPVAMPAGEGTYVGSTPKVWEARESRKVQEGDKTRTVPALWVADSLDEVDFPVKIVRPEVIDATTRAMAHKVFDRIGVVPATRGSDPIVLGQIRNPNNRYSRTAWGSESDPMFFISWWLDYDMI